MDKLQSTDRLIPALIANASEQETIEVIGTFRMEFTDSDGNVLRAEEFSNLVTTLGKNFLLATTMQGASYSVTGPFMGLISSISFTTGPAAGDTMTSHSGWTEATNTNAPGYGTTRPTMSFSAPSGGVISTSAAAQFVFNDSGTVEGAFISLGTGATATVGSTGGTLYAAGTLSAAQPVISGNTLNVSYSGTLT